MNPVPDATVDSAGWVYETAFIASDSSALDSDLITFYIATEQFSVYTDQQNKAGVYVIRY